MSVILYGFVLGSLCEAGSREIDTRVLKEIAEGTAAYNILRELPKWGQSGNKSPSAFAVEYRSNIQRLARCDLAGIRLAVIAYLTEQPLRCTLTFDDRYYWEFYYKSQIYLLNRMLFAVDPKQAAEYGESLFRYYSLEANSPAMAMSAWPVSIDPSGNAVVEWTCFGIEILPRSTLTGSYDPLAEFDLFSSRYGLRSDWSRNESLRPINRAHSHSPYIDTKDSYARVYLRTELQQVTDRVVSAGFPGLLPIAQIDKAANEEALVVIELHKALSVKIEPRRW